jgi:hypothetical protein
VSIPGRGELPAAYAFRTREGGVGVLHILGFTGRRATGVRIRYKIAHPGPDGQAVTWTPASAVE